MINDSWVDRMLSVGKQMLARKEAEEVAKKQKAAAEAAWWWNRCLAAVRESLPQEVGKYVCEEMPEGFRFTSEPGARITRTADVKIVIPGFAPIYAMVSATHSQVPLWLPVIRLIAGCKDFSIDELPMAIVVASEPESLADPENPGDPESSGDPENDAQPPKLFASGNTCFVRRRGFGRGIVHGDKSKE